MPRDGRSGDRIVFCARPRYRSCQIPNATCVKRFRSSSAFTSGPCGRADRTQFARAPNRHALMYGKNRSKTNSATAEATSAHVQLLPKSCISGTTIWTTASRRSPGRGKRRVTRMGRNPRSRVCSKAARSTSVQESQLPVTQSMGRDHAKTASVLGGLLRARHHLFALVSPTNAAPRQSSGSTVDCVGNPLANTGTSRS